MKTTKSLRTHIGFFGRTNVGKSTLINKLSGQDVSIVSEVKGTTTDVVEKSMELIPFGPVTFLDTAGLDDESELSKQRIEKTLKVLDRIDIAVIVTDKNELGSYETELIEKLKSKDIPYLIIINKCDDINYLENKQLRDNTLYTSALNDNNLTINFITAITNSFIEELINPPQIAADLIPSKSTVILVTPIDSEAPKGRIILPQVQTLRDLLDNNCITLVVKETELQDALSALKKPPALIITDSQVFKQVSETVPDNIPITSFSILFARLKGDIKAFTQGAKAIDSLQDGDKVLILESCTHHSTDDDIGTVKIPNLLRKKTGKNIIIEHYSGHDFPNIKDYKLIIHCGACMTNRREVLSRIKKANEMNIPITNYGIVISHCLGILPRATKILNI